MNFLKGQNQHFFAIKQLVSREVKRKYARSYLGIVWSVLNPLMMMAVMSIIFSTMFRRSIENYPIYYMTGHMLWDLFSGSTDSAMASLVNNKNMLMKVRMPKQTFVFVPAFTALTNFGYTCIAYVIMLLVFRIEISWTMLLFPIPVIFLLLFSIGVANILSVLYVFFADVKYLYSVVLRLLMYLSALFYPVSNLSESMRAVVGMNPVFVCINFMRQIMMYQTMPAAGEWIKMIVYGVGMFVFGNWFFKHNENNIMQKI